MSAAPPDAESLLQNIPRDRPLAIIVAGHNGSGKSTLWNQRLSQALLIPLLQLLQPTCLVYLQPAILLAPAKIRLLYDLRFLARLRCRLPVRNRHRNLLQQVTTCSGWYRLPRAILLFSFQCLSWSLAQIKPGIPKSDPSSY